jgi:hypothetical protein
MTTYNNKHYNNKTRKIKLFKGGAPEDDIKNAAIDKVKSVTSTGPVSGVPVKSGKKISILIDFYKKLLKSEDYGKKLNFNKFYEIINVNQNGIDMVESITGVEELFEIFKNELEYIKANNDDKETKKNALSSNHEKTKEITIEYKNGDYTITGAPGPVALPVAVPPKITPGSTPPTTPAAPTTHVSIEENIKNTAINVLKSNVESIITSGKINTDIQTTAKKAVFDAVIMEISEGTIDDNTIAPDKDLKKLYNSISKLTNDLNTNNKNITSKTKSNTELINKNKQLESNKNTDLKIIRNITEELSKNNTKIKEYTKEILEKQAKNALINDLLVTLTSKKENYLKLLNGIFKVLMKKLSNTKIVEKPGLLRDTKTHDFNEINNEILIIEKKINILNKGSGQKVVLSSSLHPKKLRLIENNIKKTAINVLKSNVESITNGKINTAITTAAIKAVNNAVSAANPKTAITNAAIKAVNEAVNAANPETAITNAAIKAVNEAV